jgi:type I restriction enzyme, S subunit
VSEGQELPRGWVNAKLEEICAVIMGQSPPSSVYNTQGIGLPFFQGKADFTALYPNIRIWCTEPTKVAEENDILLSIRAPVGPTNLAPSQCGIGRGLAAIRPQRGIEVRYILYAIRTLNRLLVEQSTGTTFNAISGDVVRSLVISLPPLPEQQRIVEALEQQLSRLDSGVVALRSAQQKLKRYRAAVLKAAVEGKLTAEWRADHLNVESAEELLKRILVERRAKWEEEQIAKGKDPKKVKYEEPVGPNVRGLPELPEGWCWTTLEQISDENRAITYGVIKLGNSVAGGIPILRSSNVRHLKLDLQEVKSISPEIANDYKRTFLRGSEILVTVRGTLGGVVDVPASLAGYNISREVAMIACIFPSLARCIALFIGSPPIQSWLKKNTKGIAYTGINIETLKIAPIPLPPLAEQEQIVSIVEERLSIVSTLESTIQQALKRAERMRQSILHKAFSGQLVEQDPNDEPASVLLERIRREREQGNNGYKKIEHMPYKRASRPVKRVAERAQPYLLPDLSAPEPLDREATIQGKLWGETENNDA